MVSCPSNTTIRALPGASTVSLTWPQIEAYDNVDRNPVISCVPRWGSIVQADGAATVVTCRVADSASNVGSECVFAVAAADSTPPVIIGCPNRGTSGSSNGHIIAITAPGTNVSALGAVSWNMTAIDNVDWGGTSGGKAVACSAGNFVVKSGQRFPIGNTDVSCTAPQDSSGNMGSPCSFNVIVVDAEPPTIHGCPGSAIHLRVRSAIGDRTGDVAFWTPNITATDNTDAVARTTPCFWDPIGALLPDEGPVAFPVGTTRITCIPPADAAGNVAVPCHVTIMVSGTDMPALKGCPSGPITFPADRGRAFSTSVRWNITLSYPGGRIP